MEDEGEGNDTGALPFPNSKGDFLVVFIFLLSYRYGPTVRGQAQDVYNF